MRLIKGTNYKLHDIDGTVKIIRYMGTSKCGETAEFIEEENKEELNVPNKYVGTMVFTEYEG